jgi:hypothetical protein
MPSEKSFQSYFMKTVEHGYRTSVVGSAGFPDVLLIHGAWHSLVELKYMQIGPSGDKKLKGLFKPSQPPWYMNYLVKGGERLYVAFKIDFSDGVHSYGLLRVCMDFIRELNDLWHSELFNYNYTEYATLTELIKEHFT